MEVIIRGAPEEIAALVFKIQERRLESCPMTVLVNGQELGTILENQS